MKRRGMPPQGLPAIRDYPYRRSVALRTAKISTNDPAIDVVGRANDTSKSGEANDRAFDYRPTS